VAAETLTAYLAGFEVPGPDETDVSIVQPTLDPGVSDR